jgi:hypothetical protein
MSRENTVTSLVTAGIERIMWMRRPGTLGVVSAARHVSTRQLIPIGEPIRQTVRLHTARVVAA